MRFFGKRPITLVALLASLLAFGLFACRGVGDSTFLCAQDCFLLEGTLNPATVIRVEHGQDQD